MHTIYAAPTYHDAPAVDRAPLFTIDPRGQIMNVPSRLNTGAVGTSGHIARAANVCCRRRHRRVVPTALASPPVSNRATALAAERSYMRLCRDEIAAAVEALDQKLEPRSEPAHTVPLERGKLEKFPDFVGGDRMLYRYSTRARGTPMLFNLPSRVCSAEAELLIRELCDIAEVEDGG